jgi:hypothetical protein
VPDSHEICTSFPPLVQSARSEGDDLAVSTQQPIFMPRIIRVSRLDRVTLIDVCGNVGLYLHTLRDYHAIMF